MKRIFEILFSPDSILSWPRLCLIHSIFWTLYFYIADTFLGESIWLVFIIGAIMGMCTGLLMWLVVRVYAEREEILQGPENRMN